MTQMLTINEAADVLACHPASVRRMIHRGELPAVRVGSRWRVPADALAPTFVQPADAPPTPPAARPGRGRFSRIASEISGTGGRSDPA